MGTWGPGNFDSDSALNHLEKWQMLMIDEVRLFFETNTEDCAFIREANNKIIPTVDILATICEHYSVSLVGITPQILSGWKNSYLGAFDRVFDPKKYPDAVLGETIERRQIVEATFDRLFKIIVDGENT
ncbi:MAG: hypothetical protein KC708_20430 [Anaerolineae bacterium]|nr:hypothetical protein [Anaerolineae bacterium]